MNELSQRGRGENWAPACSSSSSSSSSLSSSSSSDPESEGARGECPEDALLLEGGSVALGGCECAAKSACELGAQVCGLQRLLRVELLELCALCLVNHSQHAGDILPNSAAVLKKGGEKSVGNGVGKIS